MTLQNLNKNNLTWILDTNSQAHKALTAQGWSRSTSPYNVPQASASSFVPFPGLIAYWDFGDSSNLAVNQNGSGGSPVNGGNIKWCKDLSGNGKHLQERTGIGFPTWASNSINGKGTALFDGNDVLECVNNLSHPNQNISIIVIGRRNGAGSGLTAMVTLGVTSFTVPGTAWIQVQTPEAADWQLEASAGGMDVNSGVSYGDRYEMFTIVRDGVTPLTSLYTGGTLRTSAANVYTLATSGAAYLGDWSGGNGVNANIAAVLVFNTAISATVQANTELYLADRFGIYTTTATWPRYFPSINQLSIQSKLLNYNQVGTSADPIKFYYEGNDMDALGTDSIAYNQGALLASWVNKGATSTTGNATQSTDSIKPTVTKNANGQNHAVSFGGNEDLLSLGNSAVDLGFIHATANFDITFICRRDIANKQVLIASTALDTEKGFEINFTADNKVQLVIYKGSAGTPVSSFTSTQTIPIGDWFLLNVAGDGTNVYISKGMTSWDSEALDSVVGAGNATNATVIGRYASTSVDSFDGAICLAVIANERFPSTQRATLKLDCTERFIL